MASLEGLSEVFCSKFNELVEAERKRHPNTDYLSAIGTYGGFEVSSERRDISQGPYCLPKGPETGRWILHGSDEFIQGSFRALAAQAGLALGCPKDADPATFWLHRLYRYLLENYKAGEQAPPVSTRFRVSKLLANESGDQRYLHLPEKNSEYLFAATDEAGVIRGVCEASAMFASLERQALESKAHKTVEADLPAKLGEIEIAESSSRRRVAAKSVRAGDNRLKESIRRARKENTVATQMQIAETVDRDLQIKKIAFRAVCPKKWLQVDNRLGSLSGALQNKILNPKVRSYISKVGH